MEASRDFDFLQTGSVGGRGRGCAASLFFSSSFPCSADHERGWPPCYQVSSFFRVANQYALDVRNMMINVSVQCNGGLLPDIILLTLCDSIGEPF